MGFVFFHLDAYKGQDRKLHLFLPCDFFIYGRRMQKPVQLQSEPTNIFCAGNTECLYLDELRIAYHLIQYLEDFSRNAVGDCAAAQPVKFSLRGGSRGDSVSAFDAPALLEAAPQI